jgi:hypothetical protein
MWHAFPVRENPANRRTAGGKDDCKSAFVLPVREERATSLPIEWVKGRQEIPLL